MGRISPVCEHTRLRKGNLLSGGEQQMLTIGHALMTNPDLLLMDEPSEGLAPLIAQEVGRMVSQLNQPADRLTAESQMTCVPNFKAARKISRA
jgi:ABC-type branched-subunit amino acid transport system ATPase component